MPTASPRATSKDTFLSAQSSSSSSATPAARPRSTLPSRRNGAFASSVSTSVNRSRRCCNRPMWYILPRPSTLMAISLIPLGQIGKGSFETPEIIGSTKQDQERGRRRDGHNGSRGGVRVEQSPSESLHDTGHRIDSVDASPGLGQEAAGICYRGDEKPGLDDKRYHIANVTKLNVHGGEPVRHPERRDHRQEHKERQPQDLDTGNDAVEKHHGHQHEERKREVYEPCDDGCGRHDEAREVYLRDHAGVQHEAV